MPSRVGSCRRSNAICGRCLNRSAVLIKKRALPTLPTRSTNLKSVCMLTIPPPLFFHRFRSYRSDKVVSPSAGFVDGSYVERFLDLSEPDQDRVLAGRSEPERLDVTREEVIALLEEMARTH